MRQPRKLNFSRALEAAAVPMAAVREIELRGQQRHAIVDHACTRPRRRAVRLAPGRNHGVVSPEHHRRNGIRGRQPLAPHDTSRQCPQRKPHQAKEWTAPGDLVRTGVMTRYSKIG